MTKLERLEAKAEAISELLAVLYRYANGKITESIETAEDMLRDLKGAVAQEKRLAAKASTANGLSARVARGQQ